MRFLFIIVFVVFFTSCVNSRKCYQCVSSDETVDESCIAGTNLTSVDCESNQVCTTSYAKTGDSYELFYRGCADSDHCVIGCVTSFIGDTEQCSSCCDTDQCNGSTNLFGNTFLMSAVFATALYLII
ncbi:uncharacterized protein LOC102809981 [Saccoglossus kowalevskii]|uniref:Uncharacterized protein LOC102809981 n=1 Tax=Saccoglossus kowalevskii TaxID=10224 RepID=A0ABM0MKB7_SACKO|nr:PREDICTED: uncharacterized protein LOC102809981 [Saccoglossus kowalevskii]